MKSQKEEIWQDGFRDYMRSARVVSEDTIDSYIKWLNIVADEFKQSVESLAGHEDCLEKTFRCLEVTTKWSDKTKRNYRTAINRLHSYLLSRGKTIGITTEKSDQSETSALVDQINEIEKTAREYEGKTWKMVFNIVSAYALAMPSIIITSGIGKYGVVYAVLSSIFAFVGVGLLVPALRRPNRQMREIQDYCENLYFDNGKSKSGYIRPVDWTSYEKCCLVLAFLSLVISILCLGIAKTVEA